MTYVICAICNAVIFDAERGPIVAALLHRAMCHPERYRLTEKARKSA